MKRICQTCKKQLLMACDHCGSINVRESRSRPGTFNCGGCLRKDVHTDKVELTTCWECEQRARKLGGQS